MVLAHAELAIAEFVQRHVHLGDLAGDHVVAGDQLVALQFQRAHRFAPRQDREALRLDELTAFVQQRVQDARFDRVGVLADVDQCGVTPLLTVRAAPACRRRRTGGWLARCGTAAPVPCGTGRQRPLTSTPMNSATSE